MALGLTIFLDDGGVMNDNALRAVQYRRLVVSSSPHDLVETKRAGLGG